MIKRTILFISTLILSTGFIFSDPVDIEIKRTADRYNLGVAPFFVSGRATPSKMGSDLREIVSADLAFSKLFNLVTEGPAVEKGRDAVQWKSIGSEIVLVATAELGSKGQLTFNVDMFDVATGKTVFSKKIKGYDDQFRNLSHTVSDEVVQYFTGKPGIFTRRIAFVNDMSGRKELYVADYDGKMVKPLTRDNSIVILPRIERSGQKMIFTSYRSGNPDLYMINTDGTERRKVSSKSGLNVSPSWAPSGEEFVLTLSINESPNIYRMDLSGKVLERITRSVGADTAPAYSPDGSQIVFTSDRSGSPHIYVMNVDGTGVRRLTTEGHCDSAAWSPDGQTIVYVKGKARQSFDIYSIDAYTGVERRLTWGTGNSENPAWSPDGRFIIFITNRRKKSELWIMTFDGSDQRPLITNKGESFTPHWGS